MAYIYPRNDPAWVEAEKVVEATKGGAYVHVTAYGVEYRMCRREWNSPVFDKTKSDTLVQDAEGSWLRIWWCDANVVPFSE